MPSVAPDLSLMSAFPVAPPPQGRSSGRDPGADAPHFSSMLDTPEPSHPAPRTPRTESRPRNDDAPIQDAKVDDRPTNRPRETAADDTPTRKADDASAKADDATKPAEETKAEPDKTPDATAVADPALTLVPEPTPAAPPALAQTVTPPVVPSELSAELETPPAAAAAETPAVAPSAAAPATTPTGPTVTLEQLGAKTAAVSGAPSTEGADGTEVQADAAAKAKDDASFAQELAKIAKPQGDEAKPLAAEPTAPRHLEAFAAVRAGVEAVQSLSQGTPSHFAPVTAVQTAHAAAMAAPAAQAATTQAQPVPMASVAIEIATQATAGNSRFEIRLDPPELGRIDVRMDVDKEGNVTSRLTVDRAETLDLLKRDAPQLERALQQAGLKTSDNTLQFSLRDQGQQHRDDRPGSNRSGGSAQDDTITPLEAPRYRANVRLGGLDIKI